MYSPVSFGKQYVHPRTHALALQHMHYHTTNATTCRYDPNGNYIRHFLPVLKDMPAKCARASFCIFCAFGTRHFVSLAHLSLFAALQIYLLALGSASRSATKGATNTTIIRSHSLMQSRDVQLQAGCIVGQDYPLPIVDHVSFFSVHTRTPRLLVYRVTPVRHVTRV